MSPCESNAIFRHPFWHAGKGLWAHFHIRFPGMPIPGFLVCPLVCISFGKYDRTSELRHSMLLTGNFGIRAMNGMCLLLATLYGYWPFHLLLHKKYHVICTAHNIFVCLQVGQTRVSSAGPHHVSPCMDSFGYTIVDDQKAIPSSI